MWSPLGATKQPYWRPSEQCDVATSNLNNEVTASNRWPSASITVSVPVRTFLLFAECQFWPSGRMFDCSSPAQCHGQESAAEAS